MKVWVGTKNPAKIQGAKEALSYYFKDFVIEAIDVSSNVPDEPVNEQIDEGAKNRIQNLKQIAKEKEEDIDFYLAIESGITNKLGEWIIVNIARIEDKEGTTSFGTSQGFPVPEKYVSKIIDSDLSKVMDEIFEKDEQRPKKGGGVSVLTKNVITRADLTKDAFIMALTKYINEERWK